MDVKLALICTQRLDELLHNALREKFGDRLQRLQRMCVLSFSFSRASLSLALARSPLSLSHTQEARTR